MSNKTFEIMRLIFILLFVLFFYIGNSQIPQNPGSYPLTMQHDSLTRKFLLIVPNSYDSSIDSPLMFVFHGGGGSIQSFVYNQIDSVNGGGIEQMFTKADSEGFILVFPEALNNEITGAPLWNDKDYFPQNGGAVDDLGYVLHLIDTIQFSLSIDTNRIYAAGFSNGADFTQFLGSQLPCSFAGLAAVAGSTANQITQADTTLIYFPSPEVPTSMMIVRGKQDQRRPFFGGINNQGSNTTSARQDRDFWLTANNCDTSQYTISNFGVDTLVIQTYQQCDENTKVQVVAPKLLAHVWPNANDNVYWNANVAIIDFLKQFENSWCQLSSSNVQEEIFTDFSIYPNPSKGELYISLDIQNTYNREIRVFDIQGDQIRKVVLKGPKTRVNLETINSGIYFFKLFNGNIHIATKKVLLN